MTDCKHCGRPISHPYWAPTMWVHPDGGATCHTFAWWRAATLATPKEAS